MPLPFELTSLPGEPFGVVLVESPSRLVTEWLAHTGNNKLSPALQRELALTSLAGLADNALAQLNGRVVIAIYGDPSSSEPPHILVRVANVTADQMVPWVSLLTGDAPKRPARVGTLDLHQVRQGFSTLFFGAHGSDWIAGYVPGVVSEQYGTAGFTPTYDYMTTEESGTMTFIAPSAEGTYEFRFLLNGGYSVETTSEPL